MATPPGNRTVISGTYTPATPIAAGSTFYIRWYDINDNGIADDYLAIDDFSFGLPVPAAKILTFGPGAVIGEPVEGVAAITWTVPYDTVLANLAPTFTMSYGAICDRTSGAVPTPTNFSAGPVDYTVTSSGDPAIVNVYTVTVIVAPPPVPVTSVTYNLGPQDSGTEIANGAVLTPAWIAKGALPASSILRSVSLNARLDTYGGGDTWANDLTIYVDPSAPPSGDALLQVGGYETLGAPVKKLGWEQTGNPEVGDIGATVNQTITEGSWNLTTDDIDLNAVGVYLASGGWIPASWSGTVTVAYDGVGNDIVSFGLPGNPAVITLAPEGNTIALYVPYLTDVSSLAPVFIMSNGATCAANAAPVISGVTLIDFTNPVVYTVTAADGITTNDYTVTVTVAPAPPPPPGGVSDLALWLDAAQLAGLNDGDTVNTWPDMSGLSNDAVRTGGTPTYKTSVISGQPVVRFGNNDQDNFNFTRISTIRTVFWVLKENSGASTDNFLLGDTDSYHFHRNGSNGPLWGGYTDVNIKAGITKLMGAVINGETTSLPADSFQLISLVTTGNVQANNVTKDRGYRGSLRGDIAEILIYDRALTTEEEALVGSYLTDKYSLETAYLSSPQAKILAFGPGATIGPVVDNKADIAWTVPNGTDLATLTPTFTLSSGASCTVGGLTVTSGDLVDFTTNPRHFIVTSSDSAIVNDYTVTVTEAPVETTLIWNTGSGAWDLSTPSWKGQTSGVVMPFFNGADVILDDTATGGTVSIAADMSPLSTTVSNRNYTFSGNPIATGSLTKSGGGTLRLDVTPANFSSIAVNGGTLYLYAADHYHSDSAPFNMGTGTVTVESGATLMGERANMAGSNLIMKGGRWWENNGFGGSWTGPVYLDSDSFFGNSGWCCQQTINGEISGPGGLTYNGYYGGWPLILTSANSYAGPTTVTGGTLRCDNIDALGSGALSISTGAKVNLNYTGTKTIASLTLGGVAKLAAGTYGSVASGAEFKSDYFVGTGTVTVVALTPQAYITAFGTNILGSNAVIGDPVGGAANITWFVPNETDLATVAPTFTMSSGATCNQISGNTPNPDFSVTGSVNYIVKASDFETSGITTDYTVTVTVLPATPGGTSVSPICWYDASSITGSTVSAWEDLSGYGHHATSGGGTKTLAADQLNGKPSVIFTAGGYLDCGGAMFVKEQYVIARSPHSTFNSYGAFLGRASGRGSSYLFNPDVPWAGFWNDQAAAAVSRNGVVVPLLDDPNNGNHIYGIGPITEYMLLKIVVNDNDPSAASYQIARADGMSADVDIAEIIGFDRILSQADENRVGAYVASKYGLAINIPNTDPIAFGPTGTGPLTFDALPTKSEWSTVNMGGNGATVVDLTGMDGLVNGFAASGIADPLGTVTADPAGTTTVLGQWNSTGLRLTDRAGTTAATCFMASLRNDSGADLSQFDLSFNLIGSGDDTELPGYVLYYSLTGDAGSWQRIGEFGTLGSVTASNIPLTSPWVNGATLYVLWVDDNANNVGDNWYGFDNVIFAPSGLSANILTFDFGAPYGLATIDQGTRQITITVPNGTPLLMSPTYTLSEGASCDPASGSEQDFSVPVVYTASNGALSNPYTVTVTVLPPPPGGTSVPPVCWYAADSGVTTDGSGVQSWDDISGNGHTATRGTHGAPQLDTSGPTAVQLMGTNNILDCAGVMFTKEQYIVVRSPNATWSGSGSFLGRKGTGNSEARASSYNLASGTTGFWQDWFPQAVSKNGAPVALDVTSVNGPGFRLGTITEYMILKVVVQGTHGDSSYQIGQNDNLGSCDMDIAEIIGYNTELSFVDENLLGAYFASKYGVPFTEVPPACDITAFGTNIAGSSAAITTTSPTTGTVVLTVAPSTTEEEIAALAPTYTLSLGATCDQPNDGSTPPTPVLSTTTSVPYVVTAADLTTTKTYNVTVFVGPPANDNFADAIGLPGASGTRSGTGNNYATKETDEPAFLYPGPDFEQSVWFKWTAPSNGNFTVDTYGSMNVAGQVWDSVIYLYDGASLATLNSLASVDNGQAETATIAVTASTTYYVRLAWGGGPTGNAATQRDTPDIHLNWSFVGSGGVSYADWALANGVTGTPSEDSNNDGVAKRHRLLHGHDGPRHQSGTGRGQQGHLADELVLHGQL